MANIKVNMSQMNRWNVDSDNIKFYDNIMKNKGLIVTLDGSAYVEFLNEFAIFYTLSK